MKAQRDILTEFFSTKRKIEEKMNRIKHKIAIISGKGGVGKTTISVNLAFGLALRGYKVGIIDADIYGPDIPIALGILDKKPRGSKEGIIPITGKYGIKVISVQYFLDSLDEPIIWSGPMVAKAIIQFLRDVIWGDLDFLIIDLPPGTGDEVLTVFQFLRSLSGVLIVTTGQKIALSDVAKAIKMCKKLKVPILGIVENMSYFKCPHCGKIIKIFGKEDVSKIANENNIKLLAKIPITPEISRYTDMGIPLVDGNDPISKLFNEIIEKILTKLNVPLSNKMSQKYRNIRK